MIEELNSSLKVFSNCGCLDMFDISLKSFEMIKDLIIRLISLYHLVSWHVCLFFHMHYAQMHFITCCIMHLGSIENEICFLSISL